MNVTDDFVLALKRRMSVITLRQYQTLLNKIPTEMFIYEVSLDTIKPEIRAYNRFIKSFDSYGMKIMLRASIMKWYQYLCAKPESDVEYDQVKIYLTQGLHRPDKDRNQYEDKALSPDKVKLILDNVRDSVAHGALRKKKLQFPLYLVLNLLFDSGMRRRELFLIKSTMIDLDKDCINLPAIITKSGKPRRVFYRPQTGGLLFDYMFDNGFISRTDGLKLKPQTNLFIITDLKGKPVRNRLVRFTKLINKCTLVDFDGRNKKPPVIPDHIYPHRYRHSFSDYMLKNGADIYTLQKLLGHSKIGTTEIYLRGLPDPDKLGLVYKKVINGDKK